MTEKTEVAATGTNPPPQQEPDQVAGYLGLEVTRNPDQVVTVTLPTDGRLTANGRVHPVALLVGIDMAAGMSAGFATLPRWTLTSDMSVYFHQNHPDHGDLRMTGRPVRVGGRTALAEVIVTNGEGQRIATASLNHAVVPMEEPLQFVDLQPGETAKPPRPQWFPTAARDLYAVTPVGADDDTAVAISLTEPTRNPWGLLHGAVTAHLVLEAAARVGVTRPDQFTIRYLRPISSGRAVARSESVVDIGDGSAMAVVEVIAEATGTASAVAYVRGRGAPPLGSSRPEYQEAGRG